MRSSFRHRSLVSQAVLAAWTLQLWACESSTRPTSADDPGGGGPSVAEVRHTSPEATEAVAATPNKALNFTASYVRVPDNNLLDLTSKWTLEAWVKPTDASTGADQDIISKWAGVTTASYILQIDAAGKLRLVTNNGVTQSIILSNGTLGDRTWHHVAATFSRGTVKLYVNGALDRTVSGVLTPLASTEPVAFDGRARTREVRTTESLTRSASGTSCARDRRSPAP